jgi:CRP/FNR family transcriptional regulator
MNGKEGMPIMEHQFGPARKQSQASCSGQDCLLENAENNPIRKSRGAEARPHSPGRRDGGNAPWKDSTLLNCLSPEAIGEFELLATPFSCEGSAVLFREGEQPGTVLFLLEGRVKLSFNSVEGKRLTLGVAEPGDILGLAAAVSGCPYEVTAEAQFPSKIAPLPRHTFLGFLSRYPVVNQNVARQLSFEYKRACDQLRILGLALTAQEKLARLLLEWCAEGQKTERGARIHCSLTHGEIGEYIGVARETVSRTLSDLRNRELVEQHGSTMLVSSLRGLAIYAGSVDL